MSVSRIPFTAVEEGVLRQLSGWMLFIAIVHFIVAAFALVAGCLFASMGSVLTAAFAKFGAVAGAGIAVVILALVVSVVAATILTIQGVLLTQARGSFFAVVTSDAADQLHLVNGLRKLRLFFLIEIILLGLGVLGSGANLVSGIAGLVL
jgi:hypothetical protein